MKNVLTKLFLKVLMISMLGSYVFSAPIKLKNFRELKRSLELATGVSPSQSKIKSYYEANLSSLPKYGKVEELTAGYLSTYYTLSSFYCEALIEKDQGLEASDRHAHQKTDLSKDYKDLKEAEIKMMLEEYSDVFWGRSLDDKEYALINKVATDMQKQTSSTMKKHAPHVAICTTFISALNLYIKN